MAINYINVPESDFSGGIDARSAENQILQGYLRDLLNGDVLERRIRKRVGYQGFAGNLPVRVSSVESVDATNQICFRLPSSINLLGVRSSPLVIYGRLSTGLSMGASSFSDTDSGHYYPFYTTTARKSLLATAAAPPYEIISVPETEHELGTVRSFVGVVRSTSEVDNSNSTVSTEGTSLDEATFEVDITYQNSTGTDIPAYVYYLARGTSPGETYTAIGTGAAVSIPAGTHGLLTPNIVVRCYRDLGTTIEAVLPDSVTISSTQQVDVTFSSSIDYLVLLSAAPAEQVLTGSVGAASTGTLILTSPTSPFLFESIYQQVGTTRVQVLPDSITHDAAANTTTFTIVNGTTTPRTFLIYYEYGEVRSNELCVTDTAVTADVTDTRPQLTIWGLDHSEIYGGTADRQGWVNHVDSYRRQGENRLIASLGGNLFSAQHRDEVSAAYHIPVLAPQIRHTVAATTILGPTFWETGEVPARTRGYITADDSGTHWAQVTAVQWDSGTEWTKYTISLPGKQILDSIGTPTTLGAVISTVTDLQDWLTIEDMGMARFNGTFRIRQLLDGVNQIQIWVENDGVDSTDWDDLNAQGSATILTDTLNFSTTTTYLPGDELLSSLFALGGVNPIVVSSAGGTSVLVEGITDLIEIGGGLVLPARRTSDVIPVTSTDDIVAGDMVSYTGVTRLHRVLSVNPLSQTSVTISGDGETALLTLGTGSTTTLSPGDRIALLQAGVYSGVQKVVSIDSTTTLSFASAETELAVSGLLAGHTVQIDDATLEFEDSVGSDTALTVEQRWVPIEAPDDSEGLTPNTYIQHFDASPYGNQPFLRSTMVQDNLYVTDGLDEVLKFDGESLYRAGLFPWQPGLFLQRDTSPTAKIETNVRSLAYSAVVAAQGQLTITAVTTGTIPIGTPVRLSGSSQTYTIREYKNDGTNFYILLDRSLDAGVSAAGTIGEIAIYRYYFRLNAVDVNGNVVASAVAQSQDYVVELTADAAVRLRLVGLPAWHIYDYDRLEVQIYRTKKGLPAPFYLLTTLRMRFGSESGYLDFLDSFADGDLTDLDPVNSALLGTELGTRWSEPLRAKYVTSLGNSLILANLQDYPQLDIQIVADGAVTPGTFTGNKWLFRRDNTDTGTVTDMTTRAAYEWVDTSGATVVTGITGAAGISFTAASVAHGFTTPGQWAYLYWGTSNDVDSTDRPLTYSGWWQISAIPDANHVTFNYGNAEAGAATAFPDRIVGATDRRDVPVLIGLDGNLGMVNGNVPAGQPALIIFQTMRRLAMGINATMRKVDTGIGIMSGFTPWLVARGGNDLTQAGRLIVRQPRADSTTPEVRTPAFTGYSLFVNEVRRDASTEISATTRLYPSRLLASYENYPELFDAPTSVLDSESDSCIDVNPADGQEITGIIPFFGEAAFTAAQQAAILVVFKENSIYLVDLNEKRAGRNPVQRIETEGLGCTAPYSIASTKAGIIFGNESGLYCLRRNQAIQYIGRYMERNWIGRVDRSHLELVQGHHFGVGRQYKVSVPLLGTSDPITGYIENSEVYVYDHTAESEGKLGAWGRYDNHPATGWANLNQDAYFGATSGRVFSIRRAGDMSDYRDDHGAVDLQMTTRATDFGNGGIRKVVDRIIVHYRTGATNVGTSIGTSVDLTQEFRETTPYSITVPMPSSGIDDLPPQEVSTIRHNTDRRRGTYFQVRISNGTIDEALDIAGLEYRLGGLTDRGITQAAQT